jgi:hypothetical protein
VGPEFRVGVLVAFRVDFRVAFWGDSGQAGCRRRREQVPGGGWGGSRHPQFCCSSGWL